MQHSDVVKYKYNTEIFIFSLISSSAQRDTKLAIKRDGIFNF